MANASASSPDSRKVPVLLLKTKSSPTDAYEDLFATPNDGFHFEPIFVPVLQHRFDQDGMRQLKTLLHEKRINSSVNSDYGGLIFTSQRAVEAFAELVEKGRQGDDKSWPYLSDVPIYSVGPATTRALKAIPQVPPLQIFGEHTGNGDALARYIVEHYGEWYKDRPVKPALLFPVGEQRRDVIPKTLMNDKLAADVRIGVTEIVVYGTGEMESFPGDFGKMLSVMKDRPRKWVVVFSPTGCDSLLRVLGFTFIKGTGNAAQWPSGRNTYIATIGPTTRDYMIKEFGFEPDVSAEKPSPEGVWQAITGFRYKQLK
ncbi:uroporphyrinogen-III synthase [Xylaria sp. CBS 124048]|nr:uroporphyrinogen-III synthase [Xylaria sp. CBS 124048]